MELNIYKPYGYGPGSYKVEASLSSQELAAYQLKPISFYLPELPKRLILAYSPFVVAASTETGMKLRGIFVNGKWESHVYSNGLDEEKNPTKIDTVKKELIESIITSIQIAMDAYSHT